MQNNDQFARRVAVALRNAIQEASLALRGPGELVLDMDLEGFEDVTVEEMTPYDEHYMSDDKGLFLRLRMGEGQAEVGIRVQALTDTKFDQALESDGTDEDED